MDSLPTMFCSAGPCGESSIAGFDVADSTWLLNTVEAGDAHSVRGSDQRHAFSFIALSSVMTKGEFATGLKLKHEEGLHEVR